MPVCGVLTGARRRRHTMSASSSKRKAVVGSGGPSTKKTSGASLSPAGAGAGTAANSKSTRSYYVRAYVRTCVVCMGTSVLLLFVCCRAVRTVRTFVGAIVV